MNSSLIPTRIVNKNGVATTVHKKPQSSATSSNALPAPSAVPVDATVHRDDLIEQIHVWLENPSVMRTPELQQHLPNAITDLLITYPDNAVASMHEYVMADLPDDEAENKRERLLQLLASTRNTSTPTAVHEYLTFRPALKDSKHGPELALAILSAVHSYKQLPVMESYAEADEKTQQQVSALISVTSKLLVKFGMREMKKMSAAWNSGGYGAPREYDPMELGIPLENGNGPRLIGDDLINLIIEKPEEVEEITRIIIKDRIIDGVVIRDRITSEAQSLREGII